MWQKRIRAVGSVSVEFIASGRIFALTFFTTDRPQPNSKSTKSRRAVGPWHVSLSLLEHSMPTYVNAVVVIDRPPPLPSPGPTLRSSGKKGLAPPKGHMHRTSFSEGEKSYGFEDGVGCANDKKRTWDFNYDGQVHTRLPSPPSSPSTPGPATSSSAHAPAQKHAQTLPPPPVHPHRALIQTRSSPSLKLLTSSSSSHMLTSALDKVTAHASKKQLAKLKSPSLGTGRRAPVGEAMVACRTRKNGDPFVPPHPTTTPDSWSEQGVSYVSAIVTPLGEQDGGGLMFDTSPHIAPDGTLRARLEARLVKTTEGGKDCIIC
ncbi:hypothetical protein DFH29DRAFT_928085 [Suillus ampliporus]|nr:hypothetical protein DFH29DRAFT_928085 [Suillus ampliporus]